MPSGDMCMSTYSVIDAKLEEAADIFTEEFRRLQQAPTAIERRIALLYYAGRNFPESEIQRLVPLYRRGCEDPNPEVRRSAMQFVTDCLGAGSDQLLEEIAEHSNPSIQNEILLYLRELREDQEN